MSPATQKLCFKLVSALALIFCAFGFVSAQKRKVADKNQPLIKKTASVKEKNSKAAVKMTRAEEKRFAEIKRAEDMRRREAEETRRRAAFEAQARREQAIREARARKAAFEGGLRTETVENITIDNPEGEDLEVRRAAVNALGNHAGTIVVLEPQTGKILSIINQDWAIKHSFKPCSTIKLVTAFAGLNENLIDMNDGSVTQRNFPMVLDDALAFSNNAYFQSVGSSLGGQKMTSYARILGLGEPTGLNVAGETGGKVPFNNNNARIYSHGDDFEVTPLQLAVLVSAISNGGKLLVPQIPRTRAQNVNFRGMLKRQINLPSNTLQRIIPGMLGAASYGTARRGVDSSLEIAGKTGSCIGGGSWVGLFASVAPVENPKLAVVVILRGQSERGKYAAAVAGKIYDALRSRIKLDGNQIYAKLPLQMKPQPKIDAKKAAQLDDSTEDDENSEDIDSEETGTIRQGKKGDQDSQKNSAIIQKPINYQTQNYVKTETPKITTPLFPTIVITKKSNNEARRPRIVVNPK